MSKVPVFALAAALALAPGARVALADDAQAPAAAIEAATLDADAPLVTPSPGVAAICATSCASEGAGMSTTTWIVVGVVIVVLVAAMSSGGDGGGY